VRRFSAETIRNLNFFRRMAEDGRKWPLFAAQIRVSGLLGAEGGHRFLNAVDEKPLCPAGIEVLGRGGGETVAHGVNGVGWNGVQLSVGRLAKFGQGTSRAVLGIDNSQQSFAPAV
jgi:hypothetical protein